MVITEDEGFYYLISKNKGKCSECGYPIKEGDKIFIDAVGKSLTGDTIRIKNICIYHYSCIVEETSK